MNIDHRTTISMGLVITMIGAAASFGMVWQRLGDMNDRLVRIEKKIDGEPRPMASLIDSANSTLASR